MAIIAFSGQKRSGKDTAAAVLTSELGFVRISFGDGLRRSLTELDPIVGVSDAGELVRITDAIREYGSYEKVKNSPYSAEIRRLLQRLGTEAGRDVIGDTIWVDIVGREIQRNPNSNWTIPDCRFSNEAEYVRSLGGIVVQVVRPETDDPNPVHPSEIVDFEVDHVILNDGNLDDFQNKVRELVQWTQ